LRYTRYKPRRGHAKPELKDAQEQAQAQRVSDKQQAAPQQASTQLTPISFPAFEIEATHKKTSVKTNESPVITQEEDSTQAANTRQQHQIQTWTQNYMVCMMEVSG
jgi:hypothetical protein